jgi:hypothetical protein
MTTSDPGALEPEEVDGIPLVEPPVPDRIITTITAFVAAHRHEAEEHVWNDGRRDGLAIHGLPVFESDAYEIPGTRSPLTGNDSRVDFEIRTGWLVPNPHSLSTRDEPEGTKWDVEVEHTVFDLTDDRARRLMLYAEELLREQEDERLVEVTR